MGKVKNIVCVFCLFLGLCGEVFGLYENLAEATVSITPGTNDLIIQAIGYGTIFTSSDQAIQVTDNIYTVAHGLGGVPVIGSAYLRCVTAEIGYSIGDRVDHRYFYQAAVGSGHLSYDATNIVYNLNGNHVIQHKTTSVSTVITPANWVLVLQAWK